MKKNSLLICTSLTALTVLAGGAFAQSEKGSPGGGAGGAASEMRSPGGAAESPPAARVDEGAGAGGLGLEKSAGKGKEVEGPSSSEARGDALKESRDSARSEKGSGDGAASEGASEGNSGRDMPKSANDKSSGKAGKHSEMGDRLDKNPKKGGDDSASDHERSANEGASEGAAGADKGASGSVTQLSSEDRTKVQSAFRSHRSGAIVKDIHVDINVGVAVPRTVTLYAVPEDVIVIVPAYRRYKYFVHEDKVVIVDPVTFEIVDVLVLA